MLRAWPLANGMRALFYVRIVRLTRPRCKPQPGVDFRPGVMRCADQICLPVTQALRVGSHSAANRRAPADRGAAHAAQWRGLAWHRRRQPGQEPGCLRLLLGDCHLALALEGRPHHTDSDTGLARRCLSLASASVTRACVFCRRLAPLGPLRRRTIASLASKSCSRSKTSSTAHGTSMM